jgi:hypothetical protein
VADNMVHFEDDGKLSILAFDDQIMIACDQDHFWLLPADKQEGSALDSLVKNDEQRVMARRALRPS